jgi:hypothetical protein
MTKYTVRSMVIIAPVAALESIEAMAGAIGYKAGFAIPFNSTGTGDVTHKGLHATARRHFLWLVTGAPDTPPTIPDEPTPLTEEEVQAVQDAEAALVFPDDPESETYQADLDAYHEALTTIRAPLHAYSRAVRERQRAIKAADEVNADRAIYDAHMAALLDTDGIDQATVDALRASMIVSADPVVDEATLYGRAHVDHVATANGLALIEETELV